MALLNYRNTPSEGLDTSPAQRLMSRRTRTLLPTVSSLLHPEVPTDVKGKIEKKRQQAKFYYDQKAKILPQIEVGQEVRVAPTRANQKWRPGTCTKALSDRSYLVAVDNHVIRRNRQALKISNPERNQVASQVKLPAQPEKPTTPQDEPHPQEKLQEPLLQCTRTREVTVPAKFKDFVVSKMLLCHIYI